MRNLIIFLLLVAVFVLGKRSCHNSFFNFGGITGSGPVQTETRNVHDFHGVNLDISADIELTIGDNYFVEVSAQQNILPILRTEVKNGVLIISADENIWNTDDIKLRITVPDVDQLAIGGSGTIKVMNEIKAAKMEMDVSGSGDIYCQQSDFGSVATNIAGSGTIELGGKASEVEANIAGSGDLKAKGLTTNKLNVSISGSGTVTADVLNDLDASISGSGDVFYSGTPSVKTSVSGSGTVQKIQVQ